MKSCTQTLLDAIPDPKTLGARVTFRQMRPVFGLTSDAEVTALEPWKIDACAYGTGILRVANVGNHLYTQNIQDISAAWPAWVDTGISLMAGSRPGVDNGYVWYQKTDYYLAYRSFADMATEIVISAISGESSAKILAPISNQRCYTISLTGSAYVLKMAAQTGWKHWPGAIYGITAPRLDAVSYSDGIDGKLDYLYFTDRDAGRINEISYRVDGDTWGLPQPIVSIDAIDDVYGLNLHGAEMIDGKVVVTGRLMRTSDDTAVGMDVYLFGPENFSLGRDMFISSSAIGGKMILVDDQLVVPGEGNHASAMATYLFGVDAPSLKLTTSDVGNIQLQEAENRSSSLDINLSPNLTHAAIARGSHVELEVAYNDEWMTVLTGEVARVLRTSGVGKELIVSVVSQTAKRLGQWAPEQGIYIPSQAFVSCDANDTSQIIRAYGTFTEDDTALVPASFNTLTVLYTAARATRGGIMRARFWNESTTDLTTRNPRFGVGLNYYRESKVEAAARLGIDYNDVDDDLCGHNGIVAIYSRNEANGSEGVALYSWENSALTRLTYATVTLTKGADVWLQIRFIEGQVVVSWRANSSTSWTTLISYTFTGVSPWFNETAGRGCVVMEKQLKVSAPCYALDSADDTLAVNDNSAFPSSGTLLIDDEQIAYSGKSTYNQAYPNLSYTDDGTNRRAVGYWPATLPDPAYTTGYFLPFVRTARWDSWTDHSFQNAAMIVYGIGAGRTFRILDYHRNSQYPMIWQQTGGSTGWPPGWQTTIGNTSVGEWVWGGSYYNSLYLSKDAQGYLSGGGDASNSIFSDPVSWITIKPSLLLTTRGANSTTAASHEDGTAYLYANIALYCSVIEFFSQDEDIQLADALKRVVRVAGGDISDNCRVDETVASSGAYTITPVTDDKEDFIAEITIPKNFPNNANVWIGMLFRAANPIPDGVEDLPAEGYYLTLHQTKLELNQFVDVDTHETLESVPLGTAVPSGVMKISVQDNRMAVWINHQLVHVFVNDALPSGGNKAFMVTNFGGPQAPSAHYRFSELNDLMADITVGVRGKGMNIIAEMLDGRGAKFRCEADGSLFFYKDPIDIGSLPDIVISEQREQLDELVSRVRVEGIKIAEVADATLLGSQGNLFETINAKYADTVSDLHDAGAHYMEHAEKLSDVRNLEAVLHPALQPGDAATVLIDGQNVDVVIISTSAAFGFNGDNFDMQFNLQAYTDD